MYVCLQAHTIPNLVSTEDSPNLSIDCKSN